MSDPKEYIRLLRAACKDTLKQGRQLDFYDALAISRPTGEQAVYWLLPALREVQAERGAAVVALAELSALVAEYFSIVEDRELNMHSERYYELLFELEGRMRRVQEQAAALLGEAAGPAGRQE